MNRYNEEGMPVFTAIISIAGVIVMTILMFTLNSNRETFSDQNASSIVEKKYVLNQQCYDNVMKDMFENNSTDPDVFISMTDKCFE